MVVKNKIGYKLKKDDLAESFVLSLVYGRPILAVVLMLSVEPNLILVLI